MLASRREQLRQEELSTRALVFRGATLLASSFVNWYTATKLQQNERLRDRQEKLSLLAYCWIELMRLVRQGREANHEARHRYHQSLCRRLLKRWREEVKYGEVEVCRAVMNLDALRVRRMFDKWEIAKKFSLVRRKWFALETNILYDRVRDMLKNCNMMVKRANRCREFMVTIERMLIRKKAARLFRSWPGRKLSLAASELSRRFSRRKHMREKQKIGMHLKGFIKNVRSAAEGEHSRELIRLVREEDISDNAEVESKAKLSQEKDNSKSTGDTGSSYEVAVDGAKSRRQSSQCVQAGKKSVLSLRGAKEEGAVVVKGVAIRSTGCTPSLYRKPRPSSSSFRLGPLSSQKQRSSKGAGLCEESSSASARSRPERDRPLRPFVLGTGSHHAPVLPAGRKKGYQERAVDYGYSDGFVRAKQLVTAFLSSVLRSWRDIAAHRADVRRRELFLKACTKLRRISSVFYHWLSKAPPLNYRETVWTSSIRPDNVGVSSKAIENYLEWPWQRNDTNHSQLHTVFSRDL